MSFIKTLYLFINIDAPSSLVYYIFISIVQIVLLIPVIIIFNKYFPFLVGKKQ